MLTPNEIEDLLQRVGVDAPASAFESELLDFKQAAGKTTEIYAGLADAAVCFSNARGGTIVLGVHDKAAARSTALLGVRPEITVDSVRKAIYERTNPRITPIARELEIHGVRLIVIDVPQGVELHANQRGLATRRLGTECLPFTPDQQREVRIARGYLDWSSEASGVTAERISEVELGRVRRLLRLAGSDDLADLRTKPLLEALRLLHTKGTLANAGVVLLCDESVIGDVLPNHGYAYQYRTTPGSEASARFRRNRPLIAAAEELIEAIAQRATLRPLTLAGGIQLQLSDYPERAVREIIINALIHRSFDVPGTVDVVQSPEGLVVASPGGLVAGVTPENILTHPSTPRHRLLADVVSRLQLAERTGQGVDRAYREMLRFGKEPPQFVDDGFLVKAILRGGVGNDAFVRYVSELPDDVGSDVDVLLALSALRTRSSISAVDLAPLVQRTAVEAHDVLARLAEDAVGVLEPTRRTVSRQFPSFRLRSESLAALSRALTYRRRTMDQVDAKVIEHVTEYGFVTNRTLQRLFDIHMFAARDILNDLRAREILSKLGDARGGPGVQYGPGPKLPGAGKGTRKRERPEAGEEQSELF